jgi:hypothetical protein
MQAGARAVGFDVGRDVEFGDGTVIVCDSSRVLAARDARYSKPTQDFRTETKEGLRMLNNALRMFLRELIDDDRLLPRAVTSMDEALSAYLRDLGSPQAWMLGRIVVPASGLEGLSAHPLVGEIRAASDGRPLPVSVAVTSPDPRPDYGRIAQCIQNEQETIKVRSIEVPITKGGPVDASSRIRAVLQKLAAAEIPFTIPVFLELPQDVQPIIGDLLDAIGRERAVGRSMLCAAVRCNSFREEDVLDVGDLAFFISTARRFEIPLKANGVLTAIRRKNPQTGYDEHGLLNITAAIMFAQAFDLDVQVLSQIILEEVPGHFHIDDEALAWKEHRLEKMGIFNARMSMARTVSIPNFPEQVETLTALGFLPKPEAV